MKIALMAPCYVDQVVPTVAIATVKLLQRLGHEIVFPAEQTCCGQPAFNTGYWDDARQVAQRQVRIFLQADADVVVCPSGSCAAMMKVFYPTLLQGMPEQADAEKLAGSTHELSQLLVNVLGVTDVGAKFSGVGVLHKSCHSLRELNARTEARVLLDRVTGLTMIDLEMDEECCGFGGTFAVKNAEISTAMGQIKLDNVRKANADWVISGDSSCLLHLGGMLQKQGSSAKTIHLAEVLASGGD